MSRFDMMQVHTNRHRHVDVSHLDAQLKVNTGNDEMPTPKTEVGKNKV